MRDGLAVVLFVVLLSALTYLVFPGHTYLQQDTQIYVPMLEKLEDPALFARELLTSRPHLGWTMYDEVAVGLRTLTRLPFETILTGEQLVFRAFGIWGVYLIGTSLGFTRRLSMFITALFSLGAMVAGPRVLTLEYEPVPRGFAVPMTLFAIGLALDRRWTAASVAGTLALLFHLPTTAPFWVVFGVLLWRARVWRPALIAVGGALVLFSFSHLQPGLVERQPFTSTISVAVQQLQRMRAPYNWVSLWPAEVLFHYALLSLVAALAMWRLRPRLRPEHYVVFSGLLALGILSVPFSYLTLEGLHWSLIPQFQPARAVLFITVLGVILSAAAGIQSAYQRRYRQTFAWFLIPFVIPVHTLLIPPYPVKDAVLIVALALAATGAVAVHMVTPRRAAAALAMVALSSYFAVPMLGGIRNYPVLWNGNISDLARWARTSSDRDAVFLFPLAGKALYPGLFRAEARRAVYVDWKGGGQVNYFEDLAREWWDRWQSTMLHAATDAESARRGVNYVVVDLAHARPGVSSAYQNGGYIVYRLK